MYSLTHSMLDTLRPNGCAQHAETRSDVCGWMNILFTKQPMAGTNNLFDQIHKWLIINVQF